MQNHAIIIADQEGVVQFWSDGAADLFGHLATEVVGRQVDVIVPEEFRAAHWRGFRSAISSGTLSAAGTTFDAPVLRRDGHVVTFRGQIQLIQKDRSVLGVIAIFSPVQP